MTWCMFWHFRVTPVALWSVRTAGCGLLSVSSPGALLTATCAPLPCTPVSHTCAVGSTRLLPPTKERKCKHLCKQRAWCIGQHIKYKSWQVCLGFLWFPIHSLKCAQHLVKEVNFRTLIGAKTLHRWEIKCQKTSQYTITTHIGGSHPNL